ncbi:MAG: hypothetical protein PW788_05690 [Micavibrio sp.]|nr:hypothetical protein [Micavibrio sp.]
MPDTTIDSSITAEFQYGIQKHDIALVQKALAAHVSPETPVRGMHPLFVLLTSRLKPGFEHMQPEFEQKTTALIELLFAHGLKVTEPKTASEHYHNLVDQLVLAENTAATAAVVLHAIDETIREGRPVYQPDIKSLAAGQIEALQGENLPPEKMVGLVVDTVERLYNAVREKLLNPETALEKNLAAEHADKITAWTAPFNRPHVQVLVPDILRGFTPAPDAARRSGNLSREFGGGAAATPDLGEYVRQMPPKTAQQVLDEIEKDFVGLAELKTAARRLAFRASYDKVRGGDSPAAPRTYGEVIIGGEGLGKSSFAHKKAELLMTLGLAGGKYVEFNKENMAGPSVTLPPPALAAIFAKADVILLELPDPVYGGHSDAAEFTPRLMTALQMSLAGREDKPVIFITGSPATVDEMLHLNPGLKAHIATYTRLEDMDGATLSKVIDQKLGAEKLEIEPEAKALLLTALDDGKREHGKSFTNAREVESIVAKLPDALAERLFAKPPTQDMTQKEFSTVTRADVKALNIAAIIAGPNLARSRGMGFSAKL